MSVLTQLFGGKYNDDQLVSTVENAIAVDPLLHDATSVTVASKKGVLQLNGKVHSASEKERIEGVIRTTLTTLNLKFDQIVNAIQVA
jgi:osmotically-inducible protein OsmY